MKKNSVLKTAAMHHLICAYIEQIGVVDGRVQGADSSELLLYGGVSDGRYISEVVEGEGSWDVYLIVIEDRHGIRQMVRNRYARFVSPRMAEIVAKYIESVRNEAGRHLGVYPVAFSAN
jgi:hypothetical protein